MSPNTLFTKRLLQSISATVFFLLVLLLGTGCSQEESEEGGAQKISLYDGKLELSIPSEFTPMGENGIAIKYPNAAQKPDVAYASDLGKVTMILVVRDKPTTSNDLPAVKATIDRKIAPQSEGYQSSIKTVNGHQYVVAEFISNSEGGKNQNMMFMTDFQGKLLLGTISFPPDMAKVWKPKADDILASFKKINVN